MSNMCARLIEREIQKENCVCPFPKPSFLNKQKDIFGSYSNIQ